MAKDRMKAAIIEAYDLMRSCSLCPRNCGVNRLKDERGFCGIGREAVVSSVGPHYGEEPPLVGTGGSGTIFLSGCNLKCVFCQNYDISQGAEGQIAPPAKIAKMMLALQERGCHNINFVTPTHVTPQLMEAIVIARNQGLTVPIVYNCGGYESLHTLKLLEGFVDIYMPDAKYWDSDVSAKFSFARDYPEVMRKALKEMHRQVGDLVIEEPKRTRTQRRGQSQNEQDEGDTGEEVGDEDQHPRVITLFEMLFGRIGGPVEIARRGLLVRHLVMPNRLAGSHEVIDFIASEISPNTYINVMAQYHPCFRAFEYPEIARRPTSHEFAEAYDYAVRKGLRLARG